jgi:cytoskeleton protein RodZ
MRGVTLEEISESTKISTRLLNALESDRFSELPGGIFTRNFIRAYAQYLGLDEEHALSEYKRAAGSPSDNDLTRLAPNSTLTSLSGHRGRALPWLVIAVLLGSGYAVYRYSHRAVEIPAAPAATAQTANPQTANSQTADAPATSSPPAQASSPGSNPVAGSSGEGAAQTADNSASQPAAVAADSGSVNPTPATPSSATSAADSSATPPELGEGDLVLQVSSSEDSWIAVAADGKTLWQHTLTANSRRFFRAKDFFDVTTGNAQGTSLALNGHAQKPLGREGEFKRVHLTRDNLQAQAPTQPTP